MIVRYITRLTVLVGDRIKKNNETGRRLD